MNSARTLRAAPLTLTPAEKSERLHMLELWFRGHNTARIARMMKLPESAVYNGLAKRLFSNMHAEMHRLRNDLVRAA